MDEGWDSKPEEHESVAEQLSLHDDFSAAPLTEDDALRCSSVTEATQLLRSTYLSTMLQRLSDFEEDSGRSSKTVLLPDDPEYQYVSDCSNLVLRIEAEKRRVFVFLRAHYNRRFPELAMFLHEPVVYAKAVKILQNTVDLASVVESLVEFIPSQMLVVIISCASTTKGNPLPEEELRAVVEACEELDHLEKVKQTFLEYIQCTMPLICPNTCALLGTGITSQLFAIAGSAAKLARLDPNDLIQLGSRRASQSGGAIAIHTTGFLSNCDLISNLPPQLRPRAIRQLARSVLTVLRIDASRLAPSKDKGVQERRKCFDRFRQWLNPVVVAGAGNIIYERRSRKRRRD